MEEKEKGKSFGGGKQNLLHQPKIIFCWVGFDKVMPWKEETKWWQIWHLTTPKAATYCQPLFPSVTRCWTWGTLCSSLHCFALPQLDDFFLVHVFCHKCMVLSSQGSIHPCSITFANVPYCSITFSNVHNCSITFSSVLLPVIQSAPSGQLGWQQVATQDIGPL